MLFDWFTVGAQTLNFLVLVWLMKRFLYKPVIDAIDAREQRIALALEDAALKQTAAESERDQFHKKNEDFEQQRHALFSKVNEEVKAERQRLLGDARKDANDLRLKQQDALARELADLQQSIVHRSQQEVFAITQKVLTDLADVTLEERMSEVFTRRVRVLSEEEKAGLAKSLRASSNKLCVRTAFDLSPAQKSAVQDALDALMSSSIQIEFEIVPALIGGIELTANGWKLAWNIADFLASLQKSVDQLVKEQSERTAEAANPENSQ